MTTEPDEHAELINELKLLRRSEGLTTARLRQQPRLIDLLGLGPDAARTTIEKVLTQLGDGEKARAARNAFGIGWSDPGSLDSRRMGFSSEIKKTKNTIISYEDSMIKELAAALLAGAKAESQNRPLQRRPDIPP